MNDVIAQALGNIDWNQPSAPVAPTQDMTNPIASILLGLMPQQQEPSQGQEVNLGGYSTHDKNVSPPPPMPSRNPARFPELNNYIIEQLLKGNDAMGYGMDHPTEEPWLYPMDNEFHPKNT